MNERGRVTVRELPSYAFGPRDPMWWGVALLMCIEGTTIALLLLTYFYTRQRVDVWPTTAPTRTSLAAGAATTAVLLVSVVPMHLMNAEAYRGALVRMRRFMVAATALSLVALATRIWEFAALPFRWDAHAYGSVVWGLLTLQTTHLGLGVIENLMFVALLYRGPVEKKHLVDVEVNGVYWYFVVAGWLPIAASLYGEVLFR
jgi:heme/copper-type cytochrome/quinol oxidase subunit 3